MGKRLILAYIIVCFCFFMPFHSYGQDVDQTIELQQSQQKIAYINSIELLESLPEKVKATKAINELNQKYKDELAIMQNDYNKKYSDFISDQQSMAESIKLRRMQELYELEKSINSFIRIAQEDVESQEQMLIVPLKERVKKAIEEVGLENGFTCIYDAANPAIAFVTPLAINASPLVLKKLQIGGTFSR